jgi:aminoglycoside 6'-N-acetyltransferase I
MDGGGIMELSVLTIADRARITALFYDVFTNEPWNDDWSDAAQLDAYITDLIGQRNALTLGYVDGDRLVGLSMGFIKHWYSGTEYYIDEFCIDRRMQGRGIGTSFMKAIEQYLAKREIRQIFLQTERTAPAYGFYLNRGFQELKDHVSFAKQIDGMNPAPKDGEGGK